MHSFDNSLDFHAKFITVLAVGIIKGTKVVNILNNKEENLNHLF